MAFLTGGRVVLELGNLRMVEADVVAAIAAKGLYGPSKDLAEALRERGALRAVDVDLAGGDLKRGESLLVETQGAIRSPYALFVGAPGVADVSYRDIEAYARDVIVALRTTRPSQRHVAMSAHGQGFGLDGIEAFLSAVRGWLNAVVDEAPPLLEQITYAEPTPHKLRRMGEALEREIEAGSFPGTLREQSETRWLFELGGAEAAAPARYAEELPAERKRHVFVAMPFADDFEDVFYFGIQDPVRESGFVCERIDQAAFTGDVLEQIRLRIEEATLVIAELSGANPNVYLEVGYAWGKSRPTILLLRVGEQLRFDVQGQRVLFYKNIKQLREYLLRELTALSAVV